MWVTLISPRYCKQEPVPKLPPLKSMEIFLDILTSPSYSYPIIFPYDWDSSRIQCLKPESCPMSLSWLFIISWPWESLMREWYFVLFWWLSIVKVSAPPWLWFSSAPIITSGRGTIIRPRLPNEGPACSLSEGPKFGTTCCYINIWRYTMMLDCLNMLYHNNTQFMSMIHSLWYDILL